MAHPLHRTALSERVVRLVLGAAGRLTTPLFPDDYLALADPLLSRRWPAGRVEEVRAETAAAVTLVIRPGHGWPPARRAGQYVPVGVRLGGVLHWRTYSLTTPPGPSGAPFSITVKALPDGRVSRYLAHRVRPGDVLRLGPAQGDFHLPDPPPRRLLLLTAGIGITPVMGMLRALAGDGARLAPGADVLLVHSAPDPARTVFGPELRVMAECLPWFRLHEHHTRVGARPPGHLTPAQLSAVCPDWRERATWACGPTALLESAVRRWAAEGLADRLHIERFRPAPPAPSGKVGRRGQGARVRFAASDVETDTGTDTSLLQAGESAGVAMPSGCRRGICFGCVSPLLQGRVRDLRTGEVHGEPGDLIQTCVSAACGLVTLDL